MTEPVPPLVHATGTDPVLDDLIDAFAARVQTGEPVDPEAFAREHPERAEALRRILPAMVALADLGRSGATHPPDEVAGTLGDFRLQREIGRGGMGVVYEAEQISLGRRVALKVLPFAGALDAKQLQRFKNEAQAAAHLQHPHIVPVHYVGCERGVHFYAMQYIDGHTLGAVIRELRQLTQPSTPEPAGPGGEASALADDMASGQWAPAKRAATNEPSTGPYAPSAEALATTPPVAALSTERSTRSPAFFRTVASLGIQAAEALEHAHQLGVIHRDIKPANLLVDATGKLWVTDFGLARLVSDAGLTMTGDLLGTIRYMSPEQALAKRVAVDARTDVYSLGVTLYELLTLEPAYNGKNREEVLRQIAFEEPRPPRRLNKAVPGELETIILKAMAKNPDERYATALELADDLRRFLEDKPIKARRPTLRQRAAKWARRHKVAVRAGVIVLVSAVFALVVSTALVWRANEGLNAANRELHETLERERQNGYFQRIALAEREWSANNLGRMEQLLDDCPQDLRGWEWNYLKRLPHTSLPPLNHQNAALSATFSPDGKWIASSSQDGFVKIWDAQTGQEIRPFKAHDDHANSVAFSPDGRRLATCSWDGSAKVWDTKTGQLIHTLRKRPGPAGGMVAFSPDGQRLACTGGQRGKFGEVTIWDPATGQELLTLGGQNDPPVQQAAFSPDGQQLAYGSNDGTVKVWDVDWNALIGREKFTFRGHHLKALRVAFSPDGRRLASAAGDWTTKANGEVKVWDVQTGEKVLCLRGHIASVESVAFSPDGRRLASAGWDQTVKLWDVATGQEVLTLRGHRNRVRSVAFSPDGGRLVTASDDRTVRIWDGRPPGEERVDGVRTLRGHNAGVRCVAIHPSGQYLASADDEGIVKIWDVPSGRVLHTLPGQTGIVVRVQFNNRGDRVATHGDGRLRVWDTTTWQEQLSIAGGAQMSFSSDDRYIASGGGVTGSNFALKVWDAATGQELRCFHDHNWPILYTAWHPDGTCVASAGYDGSVRLWDLTTGAENQSSPLRHAGGATSVAFSRDGRRLASVGYDRAVRIWNTATWRELRAINDPTGGVQSVAWSPDGRRLAWGGTDATIKLGDPDTGSILQTLRGHTSWVESVVFSRDGQWIASGGLDGVVKIWLTPK
jgi:WD40 repeat protein/serine/threonine protein kinase